jgi:septal ring factor EnvC (AmiA/AmiB activator)
MTSTGFASARRDAKREAVRPKRFSRPSLARLCLAAVLGLPLVVGALAQDGPEPGADPKAQREQELRHAEQSLQESEASKLRLQKDIDHLRGDRAKLNAALIETSQKVREADEKIAEAETRLDAAQSSERALRRSLAARREVLVEVLAALQRIGRRPPPAIVIRPEDMLAAIRTSILMGTMLPELKSEAEMLAGDLAAMVRLSVTVADERDNLTREREAANADRQRLERLVFVRQADLADAEKSLDNERGKTASLARQAATLKELIARMERDSAAAKKGADEAAMSPKQAQSPAQVAALAGSAFRDPARLSPKIAFADARGMLNLPVSGVVSSGFGAPDGYGSDEKGITLSTAPGALVTAPVDGWISFSGPFRSYRNVLIINVGGGYHMLLIGMDRISVEVGQFVLAGEPLGMMTSAGANVGQSGRSSIKPALYVELRKDGVPIDPGPWWAKSDSEKARG